MYCNIRTLFYLCKCIAAKPQHKYKNNCDKYKITCNMEQKSFRELYNEAKAKKPTPPAQVFIREVSELTHKRPETIRQWLYTDQVPDVLTQSVIAEHFGVDVRTLFKRRHGNDTDRT